MKKKLSTIILATSLTTVLFALDVGQEVELDGYLNARTSPIFLKYTKNVKTTLAKGTTGQVMEVKEFSSGNAGIRMKVTSGPKAGDSYWVYYNKKTPQIKVIDKKSKAEVELKQVRVTESDLQNIESVQKDNDLIPPDQLSAETKEKVAAIRHPDEAILDGVAKDAASIKKNANGTVDTLASNCENCTESEAQSNNTPRTYATVAPKDTPSVAPVINPDDNSCTDVNLTEPKQIYNGIPTYNQEGSQLCYAFTATQMMEGERAAQGRPYDPKTAISPFSLAYRYALENNHPNMYKGGIPCKTIEFARKNPICPTSKTFKTAEEIDKHVIDFNNCKSNPNSNACLKLAQKWKLSPEIFKSANPFMYVKAIEDTMCSDKDKVVLNIPGCNYLNDESKDSKVFQKMVDNVFSSKSPRPVEIGYSMNLISYTGNEKKSYILERITENNVDAFSLRYKPHASVLLGRRKAANGQCQYLLRNTQGKHFCPIGIVKTNGWECDSKSEGIWINSKELFESVFEVSSIGAE